MTTKTVEALRLVQTAGARMVPSLEAWRSGRGGLHLVRAYEAKYGVDLTRG